jgi:NosR/NirI family nitrous oxide reductase transcriptional regulator
MNRASPDPGALTTGGQPSQPSEQIGVPPAAASHCGTHLLHATGARANRRTLSRCFPFAVIVALLFLLVSVDHALGVQRFPPPDFSSHVLPATSAPIPQPRSSGWLDVAVLAIGLATASWLSLRLRSRNGIVMLSIASLAYFGFWRRGCVCAIGSIQNVALGVADASYAVPLAVIALFALPLVVALIWGRSFCAGVCPHGAIQDLVLVKPLTVPAWLDAILRILPWIYLALAVLLASTGSLFIICKFDPFVGIFRMAGPRSMLLTGAALLVMSIFIGRPYCRYLCPYGALLGMASRFAKWRPTVTPDTCTQCRLCENSCPFGALNPPMPAKQGQQRIASGRQRIVLLALTLPLAALLCGWLGGKVGIASLPLHADGKLANLIMLQERGDLQGPPPDELTAFRQHGMDRQTAFAKATALEARFVVLGRWIGLVFGLALACKLARIVFPASSNDYVTDSGRCVSCARCFSTCPYELVRRGIPLQVPTQGDGRD